MTSRSAYHILNGMLKLKTEDLGKLSTPLSTIANFVGLKSKAKVKTPKDLIPLFLESMILKPYSKSMHTAFEKGVKNEERISRHLPSFIFQKSGGSIVINSLFECGLAALTESTGAATSADIYGSMLIDADSLSQESIFIGEMKTATTPKAIQKMQTGANTRGDFGVFLDPTENDLRTHIQKVEHRAQILHHAAILGLSYIWYIEGVFHADPERQCIVSAKLFRFPETIRTEYVTIIREIRTLSGFQNYMDALLRYPESESINSIVESVPVDAYSRDPHSIALYMRLGSLIRQLPNTPPKVLKVRPMLVQAWNWSKGHSDARSQILKRLKLKITGKNELVKLVLRNIYSQVISLHRTLQIINYFKNHSISQFKTASLISFRKTFSNHISFEDAILELTFVLCPEFFQLNETVRKHTPDQTWGRTAVEQARHRRFLNSSTVRELFPSESSSSEISSSSTRTPSNPIQAIDSSSESAIENRMHSMSSQNDSGALSDSSPEVIQIYSTMQRVLPCSSSSTSSLTSLRSRNNVRESASSSSSRSSSVAKRGQRPASTQPDSPISPISKAPRKARNNSPTRIYRGYARHLRDLGPFPERIDILHEHPPVKSESKKRRSCVWCKKRTIYRCATCNVVLHPPMDPFGEFCFVGFHLQVYGRTDLLQKFMMQHAQHQNVGPVEGQTVESESSEDSHKV